MRAQRAHEYPPTAARAPDPYKNNLTFCISEPTYTAVSGDTRDSISLKYKCVTCLAVHGRPNLHDCRNIPTGMELYIPLSCNPTYTRKDNNTCIFVEASLGLPYSTGATLHKFNPWLLNNCSNLHVASNQVYGHVLCGAPQGGAATGAAPPPGVTSLPQTGSYTETAPPTNATVAKSTTFRGGKWTGHRQTFLRANPSLAAGDCDGLLVARDAYSMLPTGIAPPAAQVWKRHSLSI
ncbi:hypothetical protein IFM53868_07900 [Aspergillus udagawae]|uniref:LysM domain-containing protein n=1 Tax=Aspergillus udagawae TaxID=91492 RepID=A0ABQ1B783_9EURO|nr:hypothetical protein IFM53868_07900 [Aspergillus udagawae]